MPHLIETPRGAPSSVGWTLEPFLQGRPGTAADRASLDLRRFRAAARGLPPRPSPAPRLPHGWTRLTRLGGLTGPIHGDLHPGNLLRTNAGIAVIDWEEARIGPLAVDDAAPGSPDHARAELAACAAAEPDRSRALARGLLARPPRRRRPLHERGFPAV